MHLQPFRTALVMGGALTFLTVCVVGGAVAQPLVGPAPAIATTGSSPTPWAWGAVRVLGVSGTAGVFPYHGTLMFGSSVIVHQTNLSATSYSLTVTRTSGVFLNVTYCFPNCRSPTVTGTLQHHAWEVASVTANVSTAGTVTVGATSVPAVALLSSNGSVSAHVRESGTYVLRGTLQLERNLSVDVNGAWGLGLTPALGLVPLNLSSGESWSSSSTFALTGTLSWLYGTLAAGPLATAADNTSGHGSLSLSKGGTVSLTGTDAGATVRFGHAVYAAINVTIAGPFSLREGFVLIPVAADLFGSSGEQWNTTETANASATETTVEVSSPLVGSAHLGFFASGLVWSTAGKNPASGGGLLPAVAPEAGSNATFVQASPESVAQATSQGNCLSSGLGCPALGGPASSLVEEIVVVSVSAGTAVILFALVAERRRLPPPPYPNAELYPPGTSMAPNAPAPPNPPAPPSDDDPLSHLW
jgi:hypothetical protein